MKFTHANIWAGVSLALATAIFAAGCAEPENSGATVSETTSVRPVSLRSASAVELPTPTSSSLVELQSLRGSAFNRAYLSQMIAHYEASVAMAKQARQNNPTPAVEQRAREILTTHNPKITQLTWWLSAWYGTRPDAHQRALVQSDVQGMARAATYSPTMFYTMRVYHDQAILDASRVALNYSEDRRIRNFAQDIIAARSQKVAENRNRIRIFSEI